MKTGPKGRYSQNLETSKLNSAPNSSWVLTPQDIDNHAIDELMEEEEEE